MVNVHPQSFRRPRQVRLWATLRVRTRHPKWELAPRRRPSRQRGNSSRKTHSPVDRTNTPQMTRPLGSTPTAPSRGLTATTSRSVSTPRDGTHCLTGTTDSATPSRHPTHRGPQYRGMPSHVPCRSSRPGSRRLHAGHRLARNTDTRQTHPGLTNYTPVLMPPD